MCARRGRERETWTSPFAAALRSRVSLRLRLRQRASSGTRLPNTRLKPRLDAIALSLAVAFSVTHTHRPSRRTLPASPDHYPRPASDHGSSPSATTRSQADSANKNSPATSSTIHIIGASWSGPTVHAYTAQAAAVLTLIPGCKATASDWRTRRPSTRVQPEQVRQPYLSYPQVDCAPLAGKVTLQVLRCHVPHSLSSPVSVFSLPPSTSTGPPKLHVA